MEIKKSQSNLIQQNISAEQKETSSAAVSRQTKTGIGNVKDQFETPKANSLAGSIANRVALQQRFESVKQKMTNFLNPDKFSSQPADQTQSDLFTTMLAYLKMVQKEARQDRKIERASKELGLQAKESKIELDNKKIDEGMKEAGEKADIAMSAATTGMVIGVAQGLVQIGAAAASAAGTGDAVKKGNPMAEASLEFLIGQAGKLQQGDQQHQLDQLADRLNQLKGAAAHIKEAMIKKTTDDDQKNKVYDRYNSLISWFSDHKDD